MSTTTASASLTSSATTTTTTITSMQTTHAPKVFGSSSLLFGFVFMALLIIFMAVGFLWQRVVIGRHRSLMSLVEQIREMEILQSKPIIWDTHTKSADKRGREPVCYWRDFKPLSVQLRPRSEQTINKTSDAQLQSDLPTPRPNHPSVFKRFLDWLDPRPFYNPLLPGPPPGFVLPPALSQTRTTRQQSRPKANQSKSEKGKDRDVRGKRSVDRNLAVSVIIAMPTPTPRRGNFAAGPLPTPPFLERSPTLIAEEPEELYYELGVAQVPLRMRSTPKSSRTSSKEEGDDYDSLLDDLFDDADDYDHANAHDDKANADNVGVNIVRISQ